MLSLNFSHFTSIFYGSFIVRQYREIEFAQISGIVVPIDRKRSSLIACIFASFRNDLFLCFVFSVGVSNSAFDHIITLIKV